MHKLLLLFVAGGCGTLSRYWLGGWVQRASAGEFPYGTLVVNLLGCLLFGFVWSLADERLIVSGETRFLILTGFMGAFTTFSTFAFETGDLLQDSQWWSAAGNVFVHNICGIAGVSLGIITGKLL